jgi:hypothetical protein
MFNYIAFMLSVWPKPPSVLARLGVEMGQVTIVGSCENEEISGRKLLFRPKNPKLPTQNFSLPGANLYKGILSSQLWLVSLKHRVRAFLVADIALEDTSGGLRSIAFVYKIGIDRIHPVGELHSNQEIRRLKRPGGGQVLVRSYEIGDNLGHAEMPRWEEIFDVRGGSLHQITADAKWFYRPWAAHLWRVLKAHPDDREIWAHYGLALSYEGVHRNSLREIERLRRGLSRSGHKELAREVPRFRDWPKPDTFGPDVDDALYR